MDQLLKTLTTAAICMTLVVIAALAFRDARYPAFQYCAAQSGDALGCAAEIYGGEK